MWVNCEYLTEHDSQKTSGTEKIGKSDMNIYLKGHVDRYLDEDSDSGLDKEPLDYKFEKTKGSRFNLKEGDQFTVFIMDTTPLVTVTVVQMDNKPLAG